MTHASTATARLRRVVPLTLAAWAALLAAGCASARPRLPEPDAGARREIVQPASTRCGGGRCTSEAVVGGRRVRLESRIRLLSPEEVGGRSAGALGRRALSAVGSALLRRVGVATSTTAIGIGTRTIRDPAGTLDLTCDVAWIDEERRTRGEEPTDVVRVAEGMRCTASLRGDSAVRRWRFARGLSPARDSLALIVGASYPAAGRPVDLPPQLERVGTGGAPPPPAYTIEAIATHARLAGVIDVPGYRWVVRRQGGTVVGTLHHSARPLTVVDLAESADSEEAEVLRLVGVCLAVPLVAR